MRRAVGKTDIGQKRFANQDAFAIEQLSEDAVLAVLCDGMGGTSGGNIASQTAVKIITKQLKKSWRPDLSDLSIKSLMLSAVSAANAVVYDMARHNDKLAGMGTTMETVLIRGETAYAAHIGDSSIYLFGKEGVRKLTKDHTLVQSLVDQGKLAPEAVQNHPQKHLITRALGVEPNVDMDYEQWDLERDSGLLMCSDGLTNHMDLEEIQKILQNCDSDNESRVAQLIQGANQNGGTDNITVVLIPNWEESMNG